MERLGTVVIQLEEAKRLLIQERPERHRIALILLDNAAELQLLRAMESEPSYDEIYERLRQQIGQLGASDMPPALGAIAKRKPLTAERRARLKRFFGEKLAYLSAEKSKLAPSVAEVLSYLHDYRNHAYHGGRFTPGLVRALALLLFDLNCRLLEDLKPGTTVWSSNGDYSWLEDGYGVSGRGGGSFGKAIVAVTTKFRAELGNRFAEIRPALIADFQARLSEVDQALDFIRKNARTEMSVEDSLRFAQFHALASKQSPEKGIARVEDLVPAYGARDLSRIRSGLRSLEKAPDHVSAFARYARLVERLSPIFSDVLSLASGIEEMIQMQIDIARGK